MVTILITGSAGFIGSHLVRYVLEHTDWNIVGIDSFAHRGDSLRLVEDKRYQVYCHDLNAPISRRLIDRIGSVDYIVNLASDSHVDRSIDEPIDFVLNNVRIALHMLEYARAVRPITFLQFSTDEVYGAAAPGHRHAEWSTILPSNPYAASKASQEAIAISYWRTYEVPLLLVNTMNVFGEMQDKEKFIPLLISKISKGEKVQIHGTQYNIGSRFYIHAGSVADGIMWLLQNTRAINYIDGSKWDRPDRFNIVGSEEIDNLGMANLVACILCKPLNYELVDFHKARPGHDRRYALDGSKLEKLGWKPPADFRDSLKNVVRWMMKHQEWL